MKVTAQARETKKGYSISLVLRYNERQVVATTGLLVERKPSKSDLRTITKNHQAEIRRFLGSYSEPKGEIDTFLEETFKNLAKGKEIGSTDFFHIMDELIRTKKTDGTKSVYYQTQRKLKSFDPKCSFESMDYRWLLRFEEFCSRTMKPNAYSIHFRNIRAVFNYAITVGYTSEYPFRRFRIRQEETSKRSLSLEQVKSLLEHRKCLVEAENKSERENYLVYLERKYIDVFILMILLGGIAPIDLANLKETRNGRVFFRRKKTGKAVDMVLVDSAKEIISRYQGREYLLDIMNRYGNYQTFFQHQARVLSKILGERVSPYAARHTCATFLSDLDVSEATIGLILGHSSHSVTSIYIKPNLKKADEALRRLEKLIFE